MMGKMTMTRGKLVKTSLAGIVTFLLVTMSMFHIFFPARSVTLKPNDLEYHKTINERNTLLNKHLEDLKNKIITPENYYEKTTLLLSDYSQKIKILNNKRNLLKKNLSFRGRTSLRFWIFIFGLVSALMFFSCKSLYDDIINGSNYGFQFVSLTGITVAFFWLIHLIFLTQKDFSENSYVLIISLCAWLATFFTYFLVKNYTYKDDIILKQLSLIDKIKTIHYPRVALKALYAERNDKAMLATDTVKENADAFDKDIVSTLKDV